jgi:hypothetical protein
MSNTLKAELSIAASISAGTLIIHGFSFQAIAICLYFAATAFFKGRREISFILYLIGGISLLSFGESASEPLIAAGTLLAVLFSATVRTRIIYLLASSSLLLSGSIEGLLPITATVFAAVPAGVAEWRVLIVAAGLVLTLITSGLPTSAQRQFCYSDEEIHGNTVIWPQRYELKLNMPEIRLQAHGEAISNMTVLVSGGGVRDRSEVGLIVSGERSYEIYSGENMIKVELPVFPISIQLTREWKPFTHPVIHLIYAEASL